MRRGPLSALGRLFRRRRSLGEQEPSIECGPQFTRFHFRLVKVVYVIVYLAVVVTLFVLVDRAGKPPIWVVLLNGFLMLILVPSASDLFISYDKWIELTEPQRKTSELDSLDIPDGRQSPFGTKRKGQGGTKN